MTHHAKPAHWDYLLKRADLPTCSCVLELHHRLEALEAAANAKPQAPAPAPALAGLVERVTQAIADDEAPVDLWRPEARAAILAVADWMHANHFEVAAQFLRHEVDR